MRYAVFAAFLVLCSPCAHAAQDWVPLFNGADLTNWHTVGDGKWTVQDGVIVGETGGGGYGWLVSDKEYSNFVLRVQFKWEGGNSGVQFRSWMVGEHAHGYQADLDPSSPSYTGMLYDEGERGIMQQPPMNTADLLDRQGWNDYEISALGDHIMLFINGMKTVDIRDNRTAKGILALQVHSGQNIRLRWRNIRILEVAEGVDWQYLFNGTDLAGWKAHGGGKWSVENGEIAGQTGDGNWGWLVADKEYGDLVLRARVRFAGPGNSGIQFRSRLEGGNMRGYQADCDPKQTGGTGGIYYQGGTRGWLAQPSAEARAAYKTDGWNDLEVSAIGDHMSVHLNGWLGAEITDDEAKSGLIGLQVHSGQGVDARFTDLRILDLSGGP